MKEESKRILQSVFNTLKSKRVIGGFIMIGSHYLPEDFRYPIQYMGELIFGVGAIHAGIKERKANLK